MEKDEILDALEDEREKFLDAIEGLSDEELELPGVVGEWSIKDLMSHISAWEAELIKLLWQARQGGKPSTIHFSGTPVDQINTGWFQETRTRPLERVLADFHAVRKQTARRVETFNDKDLNDTKRFPWLKDQPLFQWIADDSFAHEAEHTAQILAWRAGREGRSRTDQ